ncbi:hypothetical protein BC826DRAFT_46619 [Russula brevipes]|nr:hypothetical protein BC826DRAFT_46619 [Russula brevipes]
MRYLRLRRTDILSEYAFSAIGLAFEVALVETGTDRGLALRLRPGCRWRRHVKTWSWSRYCHQGLLVVCCTIHTSK